jgi:hypothetical protein
MAFVYRMDFSCCGDADEVLLEHETFFTEQEIRDMLSFVVLDPGDMFEERKHQLLVKLCEYGFTCVDYQYVDMVYLMRRLVKQ